MSGRGTRRKKHREGSYQLQKTIHEGIDFKDFRNPWTYSNAVFQQMMISLAGSDKTGCVK